MSAISPALTASSSTTAFNPSLNSYDLDKDMSMDNVQDFSDIFNFDQFDSAESDQSHSPKTISPNHTPSPVPGVGSPEALSPSYDFLNPNVDMSYDQYATLPKASSAPPAQEDVVVKQEPVEFGFNVQPPPPLSQSPPVRAPQLQAAPAPAPQPNDFTSLPLDQQAALQQLLENMVKYQTQFGLDLGAANNAPPATMGTIEPSMLFNTPASVQQSVASSFGSPSANQVKQSPPEPVQEDHEDHDDTLIAIDPSEEPIRNDRQVSMSSADDIDAKIDGLVPLPAIFSAGRGKGGKKGGGLSSVVRGDDEEVDEDDSWRPSPEEYKKLSSKEKRQLRNKLSARAFRTRRKDYIGTLEAHIKDRDNVIDAIRSELVHSRVENQDLRRELEALKKSTMSILHPESAASTSTAPTLMSNFTMSPTLPVMPEAGPSNTRRAPSPKFNTRKDLPSSALDGSKAFWGGSNDLLGGGSTICHTMFTPDLVLPAGSPAGIKSIHDLPRVNINPRLNEESSRSAPVMPPNKSDDLQGTFSDWSENNQFNLRSMDSYRMQIWSRLAREAAAEKTSMAADIRPKFYTESASSTAVSLAANATTHITSKLASSFWSAFTRSPGSASDGGLDTDKLAAVVTGQAKLKVVPSKESDHATDDLIASLGALKLQSGMSSAEGLGLRARENPLGAITNFVLKFTPTMTC